MSLFKITIFRWIKLKKWRMYNLVPLLQIQMILKWKIQSFLKDIRINNKNRLIIGQLNINSLRNKFEQLSIMINGNIDIFMISETKLDETFPAAQFYFKVFAIPTDLIVIATVVALCSILERIYLHD